MNFQIGEKVKFNKITNKNAGIETPRGIIIETDKDTVTIANFCGGVFVLNKKDTVYLE